MREASGGGIAGQIVRFGAIGTLAFVLDVAVYNVLVFGALGLPGPMAEWPMVSKAVSVGVAAALTWAGNRTWTFRDGVPRDLHHELGIFVLVNLGGLLVAVGTLGFSRYVLDLHGQLADNISANGVGFALATIFRFWGYRTLVFRAAGGGSRRF